MNNHSTQIDILPKLITNQQKLLDPIHIRNTQQRHSQNESKILPHIERKSMLQGNSKQMVVQRFMYSFDYNTRNFGTSCDRGFSGLSSYHLSQKFGHLGTKLQPVEKNIAADLTDGEDVEEIKKDERLFYKKIYKYNQMPVLALIKSFEIDWIKEKDDQVNRKLSKSLILNFFTTLQILNTHQDFIEFFMKNLQLLELNTVALKQKGLHQLKTKVNKFKNEDFPASYLIISNQSGKGYFKINFPKIEIYFQEYQYVQTIQLSPMKLYELVNNNFFQIAEIVSEINVDFTILKQKLLQQIENQAKVEQKIEEKMKPQMQNSDQIQLANKIESQQKVLVTKPTIPDVAIIISEKKSEFPEKILNKRMIKCVAQKDEKNYLCVDFLPIQFIIKEKVSQKTIKLYSPTFKEFNEFLTQLGSKHVKQIIDEYLITTFDLKPEDFDYKEFKKGTQINFSFPTFSELNLEITEEHLNNGLISVYVKEIEINNKDLQIIMEPCTFGIYNQLTCMTEKRNCTSKELTNILQKKYQVKFQLI
ncbi:unnamed protein product [Paramecium pentaurelia]|uniref:Uncharacterized protein n=1 Tax=Paramecium pentaurelia TaxID=43138 RepID=A0A8S1UK63_9CILI|nr:unnamed protein product [Paramecium pentaurelia]